MSKRPDGLAMTQRQFLILCEHALASDADKIASAKADPLPTEDQTVEPRNPNGRKGKESSSDSTRLNERSNTYTLRRLARDCPEMLDRIEAGELSVNAAAIAAGTRKKPTQAEICVKAFAKVEDKTALLAMLSQMAEGAK